MLPHEYTHSWNGKFRRPADLWERSGEQRSLDDFARTFFGVQDGRVEPLTYTFDELVAALTAVEPYDWATLLRDRLDQTGDAGHLLDGLTRSGWKLDFDDLESESAKNAREEDEEEGPGKDLYWSIGVIVGKEGKLINVRWNGEAFHAGLAPGMQIIAIQGVAYTPERLTDAIATAKGAGPSVELLVKEGERYRQVMIDYHGGLRYPKLVRIDSIPDRLSAILTPK